MTEPLWVSVSESQKYAISLFVARLTVTQRTRHKLNELFRNRAFSKSGLAKHCRKELNWLSYFLHPNAKRTLNPSFHLDELDDIAAYFRISIGELLGAPKVNELTGDEQRLLYAFRAIPPAVQDHFLGILELTSLVPRQIVQQGLKVEHAQAIRNPTTQPETANTVGGAHARPVSVDPAVALRETQAFLTSVILELSAAAAGQIPDRSIPGARHDQSANGRMAD